MFQLIDSEIGTGGGISIEHGEFFAGFDVGGMFFQLGDEALHFLGGAAFLGNDFNLGTQADCTFAKGNGVASFGGRRGRGGYRDRVG